MTTTGLLETLASNVHTEPPDKSGAGFSPALVETNLPDSYHECYRLKLAGIPVQEIAGRLKIDRTTVWRHCRAVEQEFAEQLERTPQYNLLAMEVKRLTDIEEQSRRLALDILARGASDRSAVMALDTARKTAETRQQLLLDTGILDREPTKLFKAVVDAKVQMPTGKPTATMTRKEATRQALEDLIQKYQHRTPDIGSVQSIGGNSNVNESTVCQQGVQRRNDG